MKAFLKGLFVVMVMSTLFGCTLPDSARSPSNNYIYISNGTKVSAEIAENGYAVQRNLKPMRIQIFEKRVIGGSVGYIYVVIPWKFDPVSGAKVPLGRLEIPVTLKDPGNSIRRVEYVLKDRGNNDFCIEKVGSTSWY